MAHILAGLEPAGYSRTYSDRQLLLRVAGYLRPATGRIILITSVVVLGALISAAFPLLVAAGIDRFVGAPGGADLGLLAALLIAGMATWLLHIVQLWHTAELVGDVVLELRRDVFAALMAHDLSFYSRHPTGDIVSRVASDTQAFSSVVTLILGLLSQGVLISVVTAVLLVVNLQLGLLTVLLALLIIVVTLGFRRLARRASRGQQRALAQLSVELQEILSGMTIAKNFRQERNVLGRLTRANERWYMATLRMNSLFSGIFPFLLTLTGLGTVVLVYVGGRNLLDGRLSIGQWFLFLESVGLFWFPLTSIASFWNQFQRGLAAGERVFALIDAEASVRQSDAQPLGRPSGAIVLADVSFRYAEHTSVLEHFNLTITPGEKVALVGHTGAGKSSIARLIARFYEFQDGQILVDGRDIRSLRLSDYRQHLGVVPQTPFLFSGTVAENIRYACPQASAAQVVAAARGIAGGDWLNCLEAGLDTQVGELGRNVSAGQRQLIALARILLQNPAICILDEATASVDPLTEAQIQEGLSAVLRGRTALIIAHRLTTVHKADRIVVLHRGQIIEEGSHAQLMRSAGAYAGLYRQYFQYQLPGEHVLVT